MPGVFRIRTLLVAVAVLPLAGLAFFMVREVQEQRDIARSADRVIADAELVAPLLTAREASGTEHNAAESVAIAGLFGLDIGALLDTMGIDVASSLEIARGDLDTAIDTLVTAADAGAPLAAPELINGVVDAQDRLTELRQAVDAAIVSRFEPGEYGVLVSEPIIEATDAQFDQLLENARSVEDDGRLEQAAALARHASDVASLIRREGIALALYVAPYRAEGPDRTFDTLVAAAAIRQQEEAQLEAMMGPEMAAGWRDIVNDPDFRSYADLLERSLSGAIDPLATIDTANAAQAATATIHNSQLATDFARFVSQRAIGQAERVAAAAEADLERLYLLTGLVAVATLLTIALLSRSIARPLAQLEARARRITAGDLADTERPAGGPREVRVIDNALDELVSGLQVLETQAVALSRGDTEAPELQEVSPGRIGASLQASVERLSDMATRLDHQARHDQLTGLFNRTAGIAGIDRALERARRTGHDVAVLFIDLDGFKEVNDLHGHAVGDEVLVDVAARLRRTARATDLVARLGGDEFIFVLEDQEEVATAVTVADRIVALLDEPFECADLTTSLSASVGIAWSPRGATPSDELLVQADLALYRAKARGKARTELFDEHLQQAVEERARVEDALALAIEEHRLEVWYQPIVRLGGGAVWGLEALVRWRADDGTIIPPAEFIPVAERSDLILDLDRYVFERACRQLAEWQAAGMATGLHLDVNVSGRHLESGDLPADAHRILTATGIDPTLVVIEVTETRLLRDVDAVESTIQELRDLGLHVAIDDFGTGYASVAHLRRVPATHLKIDRSFVGASGEANRSLLELLVAVGGALGMEVIAEGIETEEQRRLLTDLGCPIAQGFHFARPMPAGDVVPWLTANYARLGGSHAS